MIKLKEELIKKGVLLENNKINPHSKKIIESNVLLKTEIYKKTSFAPIGDNIIKRLHYINKLITSIPSCKTCKKHLVFNLNKKSFPNYCSSKCQWSDEKTKNKRTNTVIKKYGCTNVALNSTVNEKIKKTNLEKYGVEYPLQNKNILYKTNTSMIEKYGGIGFKSTDIQEKAKTNIFEKYNRLCVANEPLTEDIQNKLNNKDFLSEQHNSLKKSLRTIAKEIGVSQKTICKYFKYHNIEVSYSSVSYLENEFKDFLNEYNINFSHNDRSIITPKELDFFIPEKNLAIELNGLYTHSELNGKYKNYHLEKTKLCNNKNIRLIHIFENEWCFQNDIVKSRILSNLGLNSKIYAKNCFILELPYDLKNNFLEKNHIQGDCVSKFNYGLIYNDKLVSVMTFGVSRFNKKVEFELLRFCNVLNTNVIGGASKLLKHFVKTQRPSSIISYSDIRWNTGEVYIKLGFKYSHQTPPNFWYFKNDDISELYSRVKFQKHKLKKLLIDYNENISAWDNMIQNNFNKIWDCGNKVYIWNI